MSMYSKIASELDELNEQVASLTKAYEQLKIENDILLKHLGQVAYTLRAKDACDEGVKEAEQNIVEDWWW